MNLFSTRTHGMLDYATAAQMLALPRLMGWSDEVREVLTAAGIATIGYSMATRYELGVWKALPMQAHLVLDAMSGVLFCTAPLMFPREPTGVKATLVGLGLFEIMAALTTETEPSAAGKSEQLRDYTGDTLSASTDAL